MTQPLEWRQQRERRVGVLHVVQQVGMAQQNGGQNPHPLGNRALGVGNKAWSGASDCLCLLARILPTCAMLAGMVLAGVVLTWAPLANAGGKVTIEQAGAVSAGQRLVGNAPRRRLQPRAECGALLGGALAAGLAQQVVERIGQRTRGIK